MASVAIDQSKIGTSSTNIYLSTAVIGTHWASCRSYWIHTPGSNLSLPVSRPSGAYGRPWTILRQLRKNKFIN